MLLGTSTPYTENLEFPKSYQVFRQLPKKEF